MQEQRVPDLVQKRLNGWFITFWIFVICHYLFGIGGVLASTIVASAHTSETKTIAGVVSAICMAVIGFIQPDQKYRKYVIAWRRLDEKVNQYRFAIITVNQLVEAMALAEKTLDQIETESINPKTKTP